MTTFYDKYAQLEVLASGTAVEHAASTATLFASGSATAASLYFFKGDGTQVDLAASQSDLSVDGDTGTGDIALASQELTIAGATGLDTVMSSQTLTITPDFNEFGAITPVTTDQLVCVDATDSSTKKMTVDNLANLFAGTVTSTGLSDSAAVLTWDLQNWTASTTIADADLVGIDDGAGGTLRKMTRANLLGSATAAFSNGLTATTISSSAALQVGSDLTASGHVVPYNDNEFDLGMSGIEWKDLYIDGTAYLDTVDIDAGAVDGVTIGTNSAATRLVIEGGGAQSVKSTGANHITFAAGSGESHNAAADLYLSASNNIELTAHGTNDGDGVYVNLKGETGGDTAFVVLDNDENMLFAQFSDGSAEWNEASASVDFIFYGNETDNQLLWDTSENALIIKDGGAETVRMGGDATTDYAIDVGNGSAGSNNINKIRASAFVTFSDERMKSNFSAINNATDTVNRINPVNFTWKSDGTKDFGFVAQDLQKVIPQAVHGDADSGYGIDYGRLTSILVKALQEQGAEIALLKQKIEDI